MTHDKSWFDNQESKIPHGKVRTRFAPSPTGYMHVGGLRTALYAYLVAKKADGTFILRIEDTDTARYVEGATEIIIKTLKNAGLHYDEGPDIGGPVAPYTQSERLTLYKPFAELLCEKNTAYYCFCEETKQKDGSYLPSDDNQKYGNGPQCKQLNEDDEQEWDWIASCARNDGDDEPSPCFASQKQ